MPLQFKLPAAVPLEHLEILRELLAQQENEARAAQLVRERSAPLLRVR